MDMKKILFDNWAIKLLSLALSLTLWFYATSKGKTEMTLSVPLELKNVPQNMVVVGDVPASLEVRVQGRERVLRDITVGKKIFGSVDLSAGVAGENLVRLSPDDVRRPSDTAVMRLSPSELRVKLEPLIRRSFRLRPVLRGNPAPGCRVAKISVSPQKLTVEGPTGAIGALKELRTMPIDIQGADESLELEPKVDYQGRQVNILDKKLSVSIKIERTSR
jgi:YbbR domain-containing protein